MIPVVAPGLGDELGRAVVVGLAAQQAEPGGIAAEEQRGGGGGAVHRIVLGRQHRPAALARKRLQRPRGAADRIGTHPRHVGLEVQTPGFGQAPRGPGLAERDGDRCIELAAAALALLDQHAGATGLRALDRQAGGRQVGVVGGQCGGFAIERQAAPPAPGLPLDTGQAGQRFGPGRHQRAQRRVALARLRQLLVAQQQLCAQQLQPHGTGALVRRRRRTIGIASGLGVGLEAQPQHRAAGFGVCPHTARQAQQQAVVAHAHAVDPGRGVLLQLGGIEGRRGGRKRHEQVAPLLRHAGRQRALDPDRDHEAVVDRFVLQALRRRCAGRLTRLCRRVERAQPGHREQPDEAAQQRVRRRHGR